jgi:hypothetical protein
LDIEQWTKMLFYPKHNMHSYDKSFPFLLFWNVFSLIIFISIIMSTKLFETFVSYMLKCLIIS